MKQTQQVFQTDSPSRWKRFKWTARIFLSILVLCVVVLFFTLWHEANPSLPEMQEKARIYEKILNPKGEIVFQHRRNKNYQGFKDVLSTHNYLAGNNSSNDQLVRGVFYTPWRYTSKNSLQNFGDRFNTIFPEWFFIDSSTYTLNVRIDSASLRIMKAKQLKIMPILSNFHSANSADQEGFFDGKLAHVLLTNPSLQKKLIQDLTDALKKYELQGVNIDFEELNEKTNESLVIFQKELGAALHVNNQLLSIDVSPDNSDYDYEKLALYDDYIVLMAYDQHFTESVPGPIAAQKWVEAALDITAKKIPSNKIILGVAGYGYDWPENGKATSLTYAEAIALAKKFASPIDFDNNSYNLHFSYSEKEYNEEAGSIQDVKHEVWFTDAATIFNTLRFSDEYGTAGTALWSLGSEDPRMWHFYRQPLTNNFLHQHPFDFKPLEDIPPTGADVVFDGEGELLSIQSSPIKGRIDLEVDSTENLIAEQTYEQLPSEFVIRKFGEDTASQHRKLILTFDDGPDPRWTPRILDILEKEKVPASFFIVGIQGEKNIPILRRIYHDGFEIGNHTFTHRNIAFMSPERAAVELKLTRLLIECVTGHSTVLFRPPYNADSEPRSYQELIPIARSKQENYYTVGESLDPMDWENEGHISPDTIFNRVVKLQREKSGSIVLLHDAGGDTREATIEALPKIIHYYKSKGYQFTTVADLIGKSREEVMPAIPQSKDSWLIRLNLLLAEATYWGGKILYSLFLFGIFLSVGRMLLVAVLAFIQKRRERKSIPVLFYPQRTVSVIVPAYNEEVNAVSTVQSLLRQDYKNLDIIFVDDGSKDRTFDVVEKAFKDNPRVKVFTKLNGGKASALNFGIEKATAEFVVCIDADTQLKEDAITQLLKKFVTENTAAVAGNVKVGNEVNMLTRWQSIEYITAQNFDRRAFELLNAITVVPGAIGAFRKSAILEVGGFTSDTLAEDCDLTMRLLRKGFTIRNCTEAISYTEAPESLKGFLNQRFRWSFGIMQSFWKHRDACFDSTYRTFGLIALPNILIYQILLPFLAPLADLILVISLAASAFNVVDAGLSHILLYYLIFSLIDLAGAAIAFAFEKENKRKLLWMIPQRLVYRQLMYFILFKSITRAMKGELQGWGKLKRTGRVKQLAVS